MNFERRLLEIEEVARYLSGVRGACLEGKHDFTEAACKVAIERLWPVMCAAAEKYKNKLD